MWPDVVYYQSYTHPYMGWKINVVDSFNRRFLLNTANKYDAAGNSFFFAVTLATWFAAQRLLF